MTQTKPQTKTQNQSQEKTSNEVVFANSTPSASPDTLRGIFDTTDLQEISDNTESEMVFTRVQGQITERQRLKLEVEKVIDEMVFSCCESEGFECGRQQEIKKELKKRLGLTGSQSTELSKKESSGNLK